MSTRYEPTADEVDAASEVLYTAKAQTFPETHDVRELALEVLTAAHMTRERLYDEPEGIQVDVLDPGPFEGNVRFAVVTPEGLRIIIGLRVEPAGIALTYGLANAFDHRSMTNPPLFTANWRFPMPSIVKEIVEDQTKG